jgi:hypothetical protein
VTTIIKGRPAASLRGWVVGGCVASAAAMAGLVAAGVGAAAWPLRENVFLLGAANGAFSIAAIGSMMALAEAGKPGTEGVRMGCGARRRPLPSPAAASPARRSPTRGTRWCSRSRPGFVSLVVVDPTIDGGASGVVWIEVVLVFGAARGGACGSAFGQGWR